MVNTCYISEDKHHLTYNVKKALKGRTIQGPRDVLVADWSLLNSTKHDMQAVSTQSPFFRSLCENVFLDITNEETPSFYLVDGKKLTRAKGGYIVGGTEQNNPKALEVILDKNEYKTFEDVCAAIGLVASEIDDKKSYGNAVVSFWQNGSRVYFDISNWIQNLDQAKHIAFEKRNENAIYDLANDVEIFNESSLKNAANKTDAFINFKQHTSEYRLASNEDRLYIAQAWYLSKMFKGFI